MKKIIFALAMLLAMIGAQAQTNIDTSSFPIPIDRAMSKWAQERINLNNNNIFRRVGVLEAAGSAPNYDSVQVQGVTMFYDSEHRVMAFRTGFDDPVYTMGQEQWYLVINKSGSDILNGTPVYTNNYDATTNLLTIGEADNSSIYTSLSIIGIATMDIADDSIGLVTNFGAVHDMDASSLSAGQAIYLGTGATPLTNTKPVYPAEIVLLGACINNSATEGVVWVDISRLTRTLANKSYNFTSQGVGAGTYWRGGFYDYSTTDANLSQASTTQTFGSANHAYSAHPFIVPSAAGTVDAGTIGIRVTGTSIDDAGTRTATDADTIVTDITSLAGNIYYEAKKFIGTVTFELIVTSGTPTTYSLDFNYGTAKYEDVGNREFSIAGIEVVGLAGANDTSFDMTLFHHSSADWTYAATGFEAGGAVIADWSTDLGTEDNLVSGQDFAWKRANLDTFIDGDGAEGVIIKIVTGANNSVQSMDIHLSGRIESF